MLAASDVTSHPLHANTSVSTSVFPSRTRVYVSMWVCVCVCVATCAATHKYESPTLHIGGVSTQMGGTS